MKIKYELLLIFILLPLSSCDRKLNKIKNILYGDWIIDNIHYKAKNVKYCLGVNVIYFKPENLTLPLNFECGDLMASDRESAKWGITKDRDSRSYFLNITSKHLIFNGRYKMKFFIENNELLALLLTGDSTTIRCSKGSYNIMIESKKVKEIIDLTNDIPSK
jgi:hypothetical protein